MQTKAAVGIGAMLLLALVAGVQLADPQFGERTPPEVDFSEPPAEVAADAATQFEYVDYAYRIDFARNRSGPWRQFIVTHVDHSNRRFRSMGPAGDRGVVLYSTDAVSYIRPGQSGDWHVIGTAGTEYPAPRVTQPFLPASIRDANSIAVTQNASTLVIGTNVNPTKFGGPDPANATLEINKRSGLVEWGMVSLHGPFGVYYVRFQLIRTGISVERPREVHFSIKAVFWDLVRGPFFGLY